MDVPCSNAKACCLVLAEAGVGLRKLLSPIFAAAGSGAHAEDLDTKSRCCWMLKDASTCFFNMVHPSNPGCHLEACSTLVKIWSIRRWPDSCSPWQLCNAGHDLLGSRCACYTAGPLAKKFYNVSYSCNTCTMSTTRVVAVWQTIFQWHKLWNPKMGSWTSVSALRIPLHKSTALKNAATAALLSLWKSTVARVVCGCEQGWPSQLVWVSIAHPCPCFNIPGSFKDVVAFRMY